MSLDDPLCYLNISFQQSLDRVRDLMAQKLADDPEAFKDRLIKVAIAEAFRQLVIGLSDFAATKRGRIRREFQHASDALYQVMQRDFPTVLGETAAGWSHGL